MTSWSNNRHHFKHFTFKSQWEKPSNWKEHLVEDFTLLSSEISVVLSLVKSFFIHTLLFTTILFIMLFIP